MKLYLVTRLDLTPAQQAVQAAHALRQFAADHPQLDAVWFANTNTIALLVVADEKELAELADHAEWAGAPIARFREPDMALSLTAVALGPSQPSRRLTRRLRPALSP